MRAAPAQTGMFEMRQATISRVTCETKIAVKIDIDGSGQADIQTGVGFLDHLLELFARHSLFDLSVKAEGDTHIDDHHSVEDIGIAMGEALSAALGDKKGINRAGYFLMPMDETLAVAAIDISGRPYLVLNAPIKARFVGDLQTELLEDFFHAFASSAGANVHFKVLYGRSSHHAIEALFKAFGRALRYACSRDARLKKQLPSTKGLL